MTREKICKECLYKNCKDTLDIVTMEITAQCAPSRGGGWVATVSEWDCEAHSKRLDQLRDHIARQIHESTGVPLCDVVVRLEGVFPEALERLDRAHRKMDEARALRDEAAAEVRDVVRSLRDQLLTVRDIAAVMGVSPQRVSQLLRSDNTPEPCDS